MKIAVNPSQLQHIFRNAEGHLSDTLGNSQLILDLVNTPSNRLGIDSRGLAWFGFTRADGTQVWASAINGRIQNGGLNSVPRVFNSRTGLSAGVP